MAKEIKPKDTTRSMAYEFNDINGVLIYAGYEMF